jgi:hypothetical protein
MPRFRPLKRVPDLKGKLPEDLFEEDVLQEFRSPMLDQGDLDDEKSAGLKFSLKRIQGGFLGEQGMPGIGSAKK